MNIYERKKCMGIIYSDVPELFGSDTEISLRNLSECEERLLKLIEERIAHVSELASSAVKDGEDADVIKSIILSLKPDIESGIENVSDINKKSVKTVFSSLSLFERLLICEKISSCYISGEQIDYNMFIEKEQAYVVPRTSQDRIAYLKNSYNDTAYIHLSSMLESPRAAYFDSISAVCESVYNNTCEYCILPLETSSDGKLSSFYELIIKYGFKICAVYDLTSDENKKYTRYGLVSKVSNLNRTLQKPKSKVKYLEFAFDGDTYPSPSDILLAAEHCNLKLRRIDTLSPASSRSQRSPLICPVFRADHADLNTFLTFLAIDCKEYRHMGIYTQI